MPFEIFVNRDYSRTEHDDFLLNVTPRLGDESEAVPIYFPDETLAGWQIQRRYE